MHIRLEQLNPTIGYLSGNRQAILDAIQKAQNEGIELLLLPELAVCGYPPMDLLERKVFRDLCYQVNQDVIEATAGSDMTVIFGSITENLSGKGRKSYNSAIVASDGKEVKRIHKTLLPTYDVFDDLRYFEPGGEFEPLKINGIAFGITVCEDIWFNDNDIQYHIYDVNPAEELVNKGAEVILNISASPFNRVKPVTRKNMLQRHATELKVPLLYVNQVGAQTELIFDGDSMAFDRNGQMVARSERFSPDFIDLNMNPDSLSIEVLRSSDLAEPHPEQAVFKGLCMGLKDYLDKSAAAEKVVLGLSGGIDSALACTLAVEALGAENVIAVTMPSEFSSEGSVSHSALLCNNLGCELLEIPIHSIQEAYKKALSEHFEGTDFGIAEENLQSRSRGDLLMALANKFGYMLLNTSNKSELAVGYGTLYGDMAGGLGMISDLYKTEVFSLSRWLNEFHFEREVIPTEIIEKAPSAELRPDQKDSDSLPDYEVLDGILKAYLEEQRSRDEITDSVPGADTSLIDRVLRMVDLNEHKRYQSPPGLKVSAKAFGIGRRWPVVQRWTGLEQSMTLNQQVDSA